MSTTLKMGLTMGLTMDAAEDDVWAWWVDVVGGGDDVGGTLGARRGRVALGSRDTVDPRAWAYLG